MNLINNQIDNSTSGYQNRLNSFISNRVTSIYNQMIQSQNVIFNQIWHHPILTPSQTWGGLGNNASGVYALATVNYEALYQASLINGNITPILNLPSVPSGYSIISNADGTITLISPSGG